MTTEVLHTIVIFFFKYLIITSTYDLYAPFNMVMEEVGFGLLGYVPNTLYILLLI
jgi:hypothetical protein